LEPIWICSEQTMMQFKGSNNGVGAYIRANTRLVDKVNEVDYEETNID